MTMTQLIALNTASMGGYFVRKEISCCTTIKFLPVVLWNIKVNAVGKWVWSSKPVSALQDCVSDGSGSAGLTAMLR